MHKVCAHFDGGKIGENVAACGWHLQGSSCYDTEGEPIWTILAWGSVLLEASSSTIDAELNGLLAATRALSSWAQYCKVTFSDHRVNFPLCIVCPESSLARSCSELTLEAL